MDFLRLVALLKSLTGLEWTEEKVKALDPKVQKSLSIMDGYGVGEFDDLTKAVGGFIKLDAAGETTSSPPATSDAGEGSTDDTALAALKDARTKIDALISERETPETPVEKQLRELAAQMATLTKAVSGGAEPKAQGGGAAAPTGTPEEQAAAAQASLDAMDARLVTVEKNSGIVRGLGEGGAQPTDVNKGGPEVDLYSSIDL